MDLNTIWFVLLFVLLAGYAVLDGFDLGVGILHLPLARDDHQRRIAINAIAPVWDGNEVWLLTAGGALFAAFPVVYATVFSGFYLAMILLLMALIARAVAMDFRGKVHSPAWRWVWDVAFALGSLLAALLLGVAFGNVLRGLPLVRVDGEWRYAGTFFTLLNPFSLLVGVLTVALFTMHGSIWLALKSEGELQARAAGLVRPLWWVVVGLYAVATVAAVWMAPGLLEGVFSRPLTWLLLVTLLAGLVGAAKLACPCVRRYGWAMWASGLAIASMVALAAVALFPRLVPMFGATGSGGDLTIYNAASTARTLGTMLVIAVGGVPLVLIYTVVIYRAFRGKVVLTEESY